MNPTLIAGFDDIMTHIKNQGEQIKKLEQKNKEQQEKMTAIYQENQKLKEENKIIHEQNELYELNEDDLKGVIKLLEEQIKDLTGK
jgi:Cys-tRNA synthase (O-phospho-L-seryl-tRNA:Cys-tRNA synthase)